MYTSSGRYTGANVRRMYSKYEEAAQRGLELMVVRVDEARHHDFAARVDLRGAARVQVRPDGEDLLSLDQHVGLGEFALVGHAGVHRHHVAAADDIAPAPLARILRPIVVLRSGRARGEQTHPRRGGCGRGRSLQEIAPPELRMVLRFALNAQYAHLGFSLRSENCDYRGACRGLSACVPRDAPRFDFSLARCSREVVHKFSEGPG